MGSAQDDVAVHDLLWAPWQQLSRTQPLVADYSRWCHLVASLLSTMGKVYGDCLGRSVLGCFSCHMGGGSTRGVSLSFKGPLGTFTIVVGVAHEHPRGFVGRSAAGRVGPPPQASGACISAATFPLRGRNGLQVLDGSYSSVHLDRNSRSAGTEANAFTLQVGIFRSYC